MVQNLRIRARLLVCLLLLCLPLYFEAQLWGQSDQWKHDKISLRLSGQTLGQVLERVAKEAKAKIVYDNVSLEGIDTKVTINVSNDPLDRVIARLLSRQNVQVRYDAQRQIVISASSGAKVDNSKRGVRFPVSGVVLAGDSKEPLVGATVLVLNRANDNRPAGVQTDLDGKFSLIIEEKSSLKISFVGFEPQTIAIDKPNTDMRVVLTPNTLAMDEVVVTGISRRSKNSFTGNFVSVKGADLRKLNPTNILSSLQFFDPSFKMLDNNLAGSDPNAQPEFQVRGPQTFNKGTSVNTMDQMLDNVSARPNTPLFVLDGFIVPISRVLSLDPERIESVTLLKDAAATAIYGSRASNGVVVLETKVARDGALSVSYNSNYTLQVPDLTDYNMMGPAEKLDLEHRAGIYPDNRVDLLNKYNEFLRNVRAGVNTYWLAQPLRMALQNRHSLNVGGGTEAFRYSLNLNASFNPGVMKGSSNNSKAINFHMSYRRDRITIGADITLTETDGKHSPYGQFAQYTSLNPYYIPTDKDGKIQPIVGNHNGRPIDNPLYNATIGIKQFQSNLNIANNLNIEYRIFKNLRITEQLSYSRGMARSERFYPAEHTNFITETDLTRKGSYSKDVGEMSTWSSNLGINYNLALKKHLISLFANWTVSENRNNYVNLLGRGYPDIHMDDFIFGADLDGRPSGSEAISRSMGLISQFSYSYDNRYSIDFNLSSEFSSRFAATQRLAPFWSTGFRWNAHQEKWLQGRVSNLVLRASYGITGDQSFPPYDVIEFYSFRDHLKPYTSFANLGAVLKGLNNVHLAWARTDNISFGFDAGVWNNRINLSVNYYNNITRNLHTDFDLAPSTGFGSQKINAGEIQNLGFDATLNFIAIQNPKKQLYWTLSANAHHNQNRIRAVSEKITKLNAEAWRTPGAPKPIFEVGNSTTALYTVRSLGVDPISGQEVFLKRNGSKTFNWDVSDKVPVGDTSPKVSGTFSSSLNWQDFSCNIGFTYRYGGVLYNSTLVEKIENAHLYNNTDRRAGSGRWEKPGDVTRYKELRVGDFTTRQSTRFVMNDNEIRLASVSVGYRLNERKYSFLKSLNIESLSFNLTTNDLLRISPIRMERGLHYPFARNFTFSMSVLFK